jgi:hypothetical protein
MSEVRRVGVGKRDGEFQKGLEGGGGDGGGREESMD